MVDRETLYREVWAEPVTVVAQRYGLSDVGLVKICKKLVIPVPSRGYWAKVKAGRIMNKVALPKLADGSRKTGLRALTDEQILARRNEKAAMAEAKKTRIAAARPVDSAALPAAPTSPHPLVQATAVRLKQRDGWDNEAGLRSAPSEVLNINVTRVCLDRALRLMDMLLKSLEAVGFSVRVDTARKETVLLRSNTEVTVQIFEKIDRTPHKPTRSEERQRQQYYDSFRTGKHLEYPTTPQFDFRPTHLLTIAAGAYPSRHWNDTSKTKLEDRFSRVLDEFVVLSETKRMAEEKAARKQAAYDAAVARYQAQVKRREDERSKLRKLFRDAARLRRATILRDYITAFEKEVRARGTYFQEQRNWIAWASAKADWIDPLNQVCDLILDAPLPKQPSYWSFND